MSIQAGLWQRSDQAPFFNVIAMKDNEDEQVNDTHINNCFNQTISEFVFCKRAATDVLRTTSIPLNSTPSTTNECDCNCQTFLMLIARSGLFQRSDRQKTGKTGSLRRFMTACPPCREWILQRDLVPISNFVNLRRCLCLWGKNKCQWPSHSYCRIIQISYLIWIFSMRKYSN